MKETTIIYYLDGIVVDQCEWNIALDECITAVQAKAYDSNTKSAIRTAVSADIECGRTSIVNGRKFCKISQVVL